MRFLISFLVLVRVAVSGALVYPCTESTPLTPTSTTISTSVSGLGNNGYYYEVWTNSPGGPSNITLYEEGAAFKAQWSDPDDFLGRVGQRWPSRTGELYPEYGNIVAEYAYTRSGEKTAGDRYNFIGVYGWAYGNEHLGIPLVEYYVIDDWFGNLDLSETDELPESTACHDAPADWVCQKGSFNVDGANYKIYTNWRVNKPSIIGDTTFLQYFSVREHTKYRKCGKITISEHFKKWNSLNLRMGKLFEASLLVEVQKGNGYVDYTHAEVFLNVSDGDLGFTPVDYAPACPDRTPPCVDAKDLWDSRTPGCYEQPGNAVCDTSCPIDYEPGTGANTGKCVLKTAYTTDQQCHERPVQRSGCKDGAYADASCAQFGCGPFCYLNARHTNCSLACSAGEVAATGTGKYCVLKECSSRIPRAVAHSSLSHSVSNAVENYDVIISVKEVVFKFGYKSGATVKITIDGVTKTSTPLVGDAAIYTINEELKWSGIAPNKLTSVDVSVVTSYPIATTTIDISDIVFKVGSIAEGIEDTFKSFDPDPYAQYSNTFSMDYKVAVISPGWHCGLPTEATICYSEGNTCVPACTDSANTVDATTGTCVIPNKSYTHAVLWGGWALCLLIVVLFL